MSYIRRLPSGRWQATVRGADGRKHTKTDRLKSAVALWAARQEATPVPERRDPRAGDVKVGDWRKRYAAAHAGLISAGRNESLWSVHCEPHWAGWRLGAVTRMEAQAWVTRLAATPSQRDGKPLSAATVRATVAVMSSMFRAAVRDNVVTSNPFAELALPRVDNSGVFFYEVEEAMALFAAMGDISFRWRTLTELGMASGLRWEELAGLHGQRVDWLRNRLEVVDVMTRNGLREYPKSRRSHRVVPVPDDVIGAMSVLMRCKDRDDLVFGRLSYANFRTRVWYPAVEAAGIRKYPPRVMRHTAASWLVQDGVPLYDVQALLGHESFATTQRYAHLAPDAHSKVIAAWERRAVR